MSIPSNLTNNFTKDDGNTTPQVAEANIVPPKNGKDDGNTTPQVAEADIVPPKNGTEPNPNVVRDLNSSPVIIWDDDNDQFKVASFKTSFSFTIEHFKDLKPIDGIRFFLVPVGTAANIILDKDALDKFVGVEFDIYSNEWDPTHYWSRIRINVNSAISSKTAKWTEVCGATVKVTITYDSTTEMLTASAKYLQHKAPLATFQQAIDLKEVLPSKVKIGLTAAQSTIDNIQSWPFNSKLV